MGEKNNADSSDSPPDQEPGPDQSKLNNPGFNDSERLTRDSASDADDVNQRDPSWRSGDDPTVERSTGQTEEQPDSGDLPDALSKRADI